MLPHDQVLRLIDDDNDRFWWDLSDRADRRLVYERLLTYGDEASLIHYLDGALLIDLWNEMDVPEPMHTHWAAVVEGTLHAPIAAESACTAGTRTPDAHRWTS